MTYRAILLIVRKSLRTIWKMMTFMANNGFATTCCTLYFVGQLLRFHNYIFAVLAGYDCCFFIKERIKFLYTFFC